MSGGERSVYLNDANTCQGFSWRAFSAFNPDKKGVLRWRGLLHVACTLALCALHEFVARMAPSL